MSDARLPRVAFVAASLDILGGQGVQAQTLLQALRRDGYDVTFTPVNPRFPPGLRWVRTVPYLRTALNQSLYVPSLLRLASADVVHVFSASFWAFLLGPAPAMVAAKALGKRLVLHYHSGEAEEHLSRWGSRVHPWLRLADLIVVPSEFLAGIFARHGYRTRVIRNVVDLSMFEFRDRDSLRPRLLSTRNLEAHYQVDVVIDAFARVKAKRPDATLTVAGYGSDEARLRRLAGEGVQFVGRVEQERMPGLCAGADLFLNASVVDNQPVSILEAFAAGVPVVSTPTGGIAEMVRDGETGVVVPPRDPAALATAALALLDDPARARAMAAQARREVDRYTWSAVREEWAAVYAGDAATSVESHAVPRAVRP